MIRPPPPQPKTNHRVLKMLRMPPKKMMLIRLPKMLLIRMPKMPKTNSMKNPRRTLTKMPPKKLPKMLRMKLIRGTERPKTAKHLQKCAGRQPARKATLRLTVKSAYGLFMIIEPILG